MYLLILYNFTTEIQSVTIKLFCHSKILLLTGYLRFSTSKHEIKLSLLTAPWCAIVVTARDICVTKELEIITASHNMLEKGSIKYWLGSFSNLAVDENRALRKVTQLSSYNWLGWKGRSHRMKHKMLFMQFW